MENDLNLPKRERLTTDNFTDDIVNPFISRAYPNGVNTTYEYDGMSRLTRLKDVSSTATLFDRQYSYNSANQISQIADLTQTKIFSYDILRSSDKTGGGSSSIFINTPASEKIQSRKPNLMCW